MSTVTRTCGGCGQSFEEPVNTPIEDRGKCPQCHDECPRCHGTGTIMATPGGGFALNPGNRMYPTTCHRCGGTGKRRR